MQNKPGRHVGFDLYLLALRGVLPPASVVQHAHVHLLELCPTCRSEWRGTAESSLLAAVPVLAETRGLPDGDGEEADPRGVPLGAVGRAQALLTEMRSEARNARQDLARLLSLPAERWPRRVEGAVSRCASRAFAQALLGESRARVRSAPREAAALAALVPAALDWTVGRPDLPWARVLVARAAAHRANALRVAGDLLRAAEIFHRLTAELTAEPLADPAAQAEIASLEASLCLGQRQFGQAAELLRRAATYFRQAHDSAGAARVLIKQGNLSRSRGRPELVLPLMTEAADLLDSVESPFLFASTVAGRVNALCDLDRAAEAESLLNAHRGLYSESGDPHTAAFLGFLDGRIALGLGRPDEAAQAFRIARDEHLVLDRDYDAVIASLYLADALLAAGKMSELRDLSADLIPLFRSRGVARETLASLRLLAQAVAAETVSAAVLEEVRRRLETSEHPPQERPVATAE
jgi:tetratricopeptide (TPR) repeat protein